MCQKLRLEINLVRNNLYHSQNSLDKNEKLIKKPYKNPIKNYSIDVKDKILEKISSFN